MLILRIKSFARNLLQLKFSNRFMEIKEVLNLHKIIVMNRRGYNPPLKNFHNINLVPGVVENLHK